MEKQKTHNSEISAPAIGGTYAPENEHQGFAIYDMDASSKTFMSRAEAQASFLYKEHVISMSTAGRNHGACLSPVIVYDINYNIINESHSVEEAIEFVNNKDLS